MILLHAPSGAKWFSDAKGEGPGMSRFPLLLRTGRGWPAFLCYMLDDTISALYLATLSWLWVTIPLGQPNRMNTTPNTNISMLYQQ